MHLATVLARSTRSGERAATDARGCAARVRLPALWLGQKLTLGERTHARARRRRRRRRGYALSGAPRAPQCR